MIEGGARRRGSRTAVAPVAYRATLAGLREAFGPGSYYWRTNTAADTWADWLEYRRSEPGGTLRGYARLLLHHEVRRWDTAAWPLMRRLVAFLRPHDGPGPPPGVRPPSGGGVPAQFRRDRD
jgi:hypothetical protein